MANQKQIAITEAVSMVVVEILGADVAATDDGNLAIDHRCLVVHALVKTPKIGQQVINDHPDTDAAIRRQQRRPPPVRRTLIPAKPGCAAIWSPIGCCARPGAACTCDANRWSPRRKARSNRFNVSNRVPGSYQSDRAIAAVDGHFLPVG